MKKPVVTPKKRGRPAGIKKTDDMTKIATSLVSNLAMSKLAADIDTDDFLGKNTAAKTSPSTKETPDGKDMDEIRMPMYSSQHEDEGKNESPPPRKR